MVGSKSESSFKFAENNICLLDFHLGDPELFSKKDTCLGVPPSTGRTNIWLYPCFRNPLPSLLYLISEISTAGLFHLAPLGFFGILIILFELFSTKEVKVKYLSSSDQSTLPIEV